MPFRHLFACCVLLGVLVSACSGESGSSAEAASGPSSSLSSEPTASPDSRTDETSSSETPESRATSEAKPTQTPTPKPTLPGGGRKIFPDHRLVGFAGGRSPAFGRLEVSELKSAAAALDEIIPKYEANGRTVLPVYELISVIAHGSATDSGLYRTVEPDEVIQTYLDAAREHGALLLLNVQPGRSKFLDDVKLLEKWLLEPDVGLALDPEWAVGEGEVPGQTYGSTTGAELDAVAAYVSRLVAENNLPEKAVIFHQVHPSVVRDEGELREHPGVALVKSVDGIGAREDKEATWNRLMPTKPKHVRAGFKLFFEEDTQHGRLMTPKQVLALKPLPEYVLYE